MWPFKKKIPVTTSSKDRDDLTEYERSIFLPLAQCPDCKGQLYDGPRGMGAQNVRCGNKEECGVKFNVMEIFGQFKITRLNDKRHFSV